MADKVDKPKKKAKAKKDDKGVLAALPSTRPERIGTRRRAAAPAPKRTAAATRRPAVAKASTASTKPAATRPTAARRKAAAPRTFEPTQAAESAAGAADERAAGAVPLAETPREHRSARPRPVSQGAPGIRTPEDASAGRGDERSDAGSSESARPSGVELATTAVKAAGEVAQLSVAIGGHVLKRVVGRLPRP